MTSIETKSHTSNSSDFESLHRAFAAFQETNDQRLDEIESRLSSDVITEEKLARIDRAIDETKRRIDAQTLERSRPRLESSFKMVDDPASREHKAAFRTYVCSGEARALRAIEEKAMSVGSGPDGGYLVPPQAEVEILGRLANISPIRSIASVRTISTSTFKKAFSLSGPASGWVAEADARPQSANQQIADMSFPAMEL